MREYREVAATVAGARPRRVLDWGCGLGQVSRLLIDAGLDVTAYDYRPDIPVDGSYPLERYPEITAYLSSEPRRLPYDDASFDAILSCGVLEHVADPDASLDELRRVVRPDGALFVYKLPNRFSYLEWIARRLGLYYHGANPNDRVYTRRDTLALFARHRWRVEGLRRANLLPLTVTRPAAGRVSDALWRVNVALSRLPAVNVLATNLELVARPSA